MLVKIVYLPCRYLGLNLPSPIYELSEKRCNYYLISQVIGKVSICHCSSTTHHHFCSMSFKMCRVVDEMPGTFICLVSVCYFVRHLLLILLVVSQSRCLNLATLVFLLL